MEIHVRDCLEGMRALPATGVDVVVTSPPYNLGKSYGAYSDRLGREDYLDWCEAWAGEVGRILKEEGSFFLNLGASSRDPLLPFEMITRLTKSGFCLQNTIHWVKSITLEMEGGTFLSRGHFKPINSRKYLNDCHEYIFHLTKSGRVEIDRLAAGVPYADKSNVARWSHTRGRDRRCRGNVWFIPYETIRSRAGQRPHPATFPVALAERCIRLHGKTRAVVLDPFLGLGASAVAARQANAARFIGFEMDRGYAEFAARRVHCELRGGE